MMAMKANQASLTITSEQKTKLLAIIKPVCLLRTF